ncbi:39S ribosomal protein L53, mitochondrial-like [Oncorhynchus kisutch]|uniref:39S ribosomal protein L53, mitochondrial-like n=1 Tax=Oncorhynchus kisutch TaxID=8019 RepID=UPI00099F5363|nr:39S ribosomal protein L53, mitochondrial-like [Oncorhynchus kisutch]
MGGIREFLVMVGSEKARSTSINCEVMTEVKHDQSEPLVDITFMDGERLMMKGARLTIKEMLTALQSRCVAKDPRPKLPPRSSPTQNTLIELFCVGICKCL